MYQVVGLYFEGHGCFVVLGGFEAVAATAWLVRQPFGGVEALGGQPRRRVGGPGGSTATASQPLRAVTTPPRRDLWGTLWLTQGT